MKKLVFVLGLVAVFALVSVASAATLEEQIAALQAQLAALQGGTAVTASSIPTITKTLTVGSKGDEVTALQQYLIDEGLLAIDAPTGYFGALTKAAVVEWQKANDVSPASGLFGPISRAALEALAEATPVVVGTLPAGCTSAVGFSTTTGVACNTASALPAGCTSAVGFSPTTGVSCASGTAGPTGITTPGVEGSLTVTANPTPGAGLTIRSGDAQVPVLGLKLEAQTSDIAVQRVKVDLGTSSIFYNKLFKTIYLMDGSTVVAQSALNSSTVVKDGTNYFVTLTGFNSIVSKGGTKVLTLALDAQNTIDSSYNGVSTYGLLVPIDGVRGVDGAGLTETGPASSVPAARRTVVLQGSALIDSATLKISTNSGNPQAQSVIASDGTGNNEKDGVTFLVFNAAAAKDAITITDLVASISKTGAGAATATTAYLMDGSNTVGSATVDTTDGSILFSDINYTIPANTTKVLTLKADIRSANPTVAVLTSSTTGAAITAENSDGTPIVPTGTAVGEAMSITSAGTGISLVSKTLASDNSQANPTTGVSTTTYTATFVVDVTAAGSNLQLGKQASTSPIFASSTTYFKIYSGDTATAIVPSVSNIAFTSNVSGTTVTVGDGNTERVTVTVTFNGRATDGTLQTTTGSAYSVGMEGLRFIPEGVGALTVSNFMAGNSAWRTNAVTQISQD
ncbi:MAG: peptidoglycan-binding domain-containing protein [Candidatus Paceibacterota bacterium]|jgi:hypothetical protein